ncbi:MAG TPA: beta-ketoacyl synthase chain length factor [Myxococcota bacterium]|nr:beta-ketoacyl synthase chain length factor [Myxococcota bacterium]
MKASLLRWSAWAPGLDSAAAWEAWAKSPVPLPTSGAPDAKFLPAMLRRRCTPLTRTMLTAAFGAAEPDELARLRTVFSSRHGSINESIGLLENVVRREKLSPATFSHTVHNAQAGLFSIAAGNRAASSSLSGQEDSWTAAWIEALCFLERDPSEPVLAVIGDVPLAEVFAPLCDEAAVPYAFAAQVAAAGRGPTISMELTSEGRAGTLPALRPAWPPAIEFLRWFLSGEESLVQANRANAVRWRRL